ncbi:flagellar assembly protein T N-terminal domain-containing protein [Pseudoalteromonas phenolica]|uniref:flagellar assembly protein T N-terminal domain-containing protein n=1 Tax=Pseudoalteromonas phenolica TaxID=161398 RepID=UPI00110BFBDE|nr:flagellar assembly protein T N-terminal domain-containing protein [Pseudoalteromonas phenolica]TMO57448.1 flagellar biosynthesis protein FlgT [Pseudoalteromonas phenolica]
MKHFLIIALIIFSMQSKAEWFEVVGYGGIVDGDTTSARQMAVKDAITQALIFSGATVSSVQTVADGVLEQDELKIKTHGQIQHVNLINEQQQGEQYSVTLHLDIIPQQSQCVESKFNKQITITQSQLTHPEQARLGQIFDMPEASSQRLFNTLNERNTGVKMIPYIDRKLDVRAFFAQQFDYNSHLIDTLSRNSNSQYVLLSQITDISQGRKMNNDYAFWEREAYMRNFKIDFALFDSQTNDQVWSQHYSAEGIWPHKKTKIVNVNSEEFWRTDYGQKIQTIFNKVSQDLDSAVSCLTTSGKILMIDSDRVVINLGKSHGLESGQLLSILHRSNLTAANGMQFAHHIQTIEQVVVEQVNAQSAIAKNISTRPLSNIQLNDVIKVVVKEPELFTLE